LRNVRIRSHPPYNGRVLRRISRFFEGRYEIVAPNRQSSVTVRVTPPAVLYLDDLKIGLQLESPTFTVTEGDIRRFALEFDPQPFHLDENEAKISIFGGLGRERQAYRRDHDASSRRGRVAACGRH
jgi:hypothetical protein